MLVKDLSELHHYCLVKSRLDNSLKRIIPSKLSFVELVSLYLLLPFLALNALLFELSRFKVVASTCSTWNAIIHSWQAKEALFFAGNLDGFLRTLCDYSTKEQWLHTSSCKKPWNNWRRRSRTNLEYRTKPRLAAGLLSSWSCPRRYHHYQEASCWLRWGGFGRVVVGWQGFQRGKERGKLLQQ